MTLTDEDKSKIYSIINDLKQINVENMKLIENNAIFPNEYKLMPIHFFRLKKHTLNFFLAYQSIASDVKSDQIIFSKKIIVFINKLLSFLNKKVCESKNVNCDFEKIKKAIEIEFKKSNIPKGQQTLSKMEPILNNFLSQLNNLPFITSFMVNNLRIVSQNVKSKDDLITMNIFDDLLTAFIKSINDPSLTDILSHIKYGNEHFISSLIQFLSPILSPTTDEETVVLKSSCIRFFFDLAYLRQPEVLGMSADSFVFYNNCSFISSFSPKRLGLNNYLFTVAQFTQPFVAIVRSSKILLELSCELNSLQFFTSPIDMNYRILQVIIKLDDFVKNNVLDRKLGQFSSMIESDVVKKRTEMLSFDDSFSLFFCLLAYDPPLNAIEIMVWLLTTPDFTKMPLFQMAKTTFVSAVQHILGFTSDQLTSDCQDDLSEGDPLGVS